MTQTHSKYVVIKIMEEQATQTNIEKAYDDQQEAKAKTEETETLVETAAKTEAEVQRAPEQERTTIRKKKFLEIFEKSLGIIGAAATAAGIERKTYYRWREEDPEFKKKADEVLAIQPDAVEDKLIQNIGRNNTASIHFYLSRKHPHYRQKIEQDVVQTTIPSELAGKSVEELLEEADAIRTRINRYRQGAGSSSGTGEIASGNGNDSEAGSGV